MIALVASATFAVLDHFAPGVATGARQASGFGIGQNMVGGYRRYSKPHHPATYRHSVPIHRVQDEDVNDPIDDNYQRNRRSSIHRVGDPIDDGRWGDPIDDNYEHTKSNCI